MAIVASADGKVKLRGASRRQRVRPASRTPSRHRAARKPRRRRGPGPQASPPARCNRRECRQEGRNDRASPGNAAPCGNVRAGTPAHPGSARGFPRGIRARSRDARAPRKCAAPCIRRCGLRAGVAPQARTTWVRGRLARTLQPPRTPPGRRQTPRLSRRHRASRQRAGGDARGPGPRLRRGKHFGTDAHPAAPRRVETCGQDAGGPRAPPAAGLRRGGRWRHG